MGCSCAPLCTKARSDATAMAPGRNQSSDGCCGDPAHQSRDSDHNTGDAFDITHDPGRGFDAHHWAEQTKQQNPYWVTYVISNKRIWSKERNSEGWRTYTGSNPHSSHVHWSINKSVRNDQPVFPWTGGGMPIKVEEEIPMQLVADFNNQLHYFYVADGGTLWHAFWGHKAPFGRNAEQLGTDSNYDGQPSATVRSGTLHVVCDRKGANPPNHWFNDGKKWGQD